MQDSSSDSRLRAVQLFLREKNEQAVYDEKFLISILLVYVAKGDGHIDPSETERMLDIVSNWFGITDAESMELLTAAVRRFADDDNLVERLREISKDLSHLERRSVFDMLLDVVMADGELADGEVRTVRFAGEILELAQEEIDAGLLSVR